LDFQWFTIHELWQILQQPYLIEVIETIDVSANSVQAVNKMG